MGRKENYFGIAMLWKKWWTVEMNLDCSDKQVQVKDSLDLLVGGVPVILSAQTLDANQETSDLESKKSVTRSRDGVASFVVNLPAGVTVLEFNVSWILLLNFLGQRVLLTVCFGQCAEHKCGRFYTWVQWTVLQFCILPPPPKKHRRQSADPLNDPEEHKSINFFIWDELFSVKSVRLY